MGRQEAEGPGAGEVRLLPGFHVFGLPCLRIGFFCWQDSNLNITKES